MNRAAVMLPSDSQVPTTGFPARSACLTRLVRMEGGSRKPANLAGRGGAGRAWCRGYYTGPGSAPRRFSGCRSSPARENAYHAVARPRPPLMDVDIAAIDRTVKERRGTLDPLFAELQKVIVGQRSLLERLL